MARAGIARRRDLLDRWRGIHEDEKIADDGEPQAAKQSRLIEAKEDWFSDCFEFLHSLPKEEHIWCGYADMMGPFLETFHVYFSNKEENSPLRTIWKRVSQELDICTQCVCEHHQAQEFYDSEYQSDTVAPLLKVLLLLDEERVTEHLKQLNAKIQLKEYDRSRHSAEVVSVMFEVLMYPVLLDDQSLANQFQIFIETIDESYEVSLSTSQQYPGVYALLFFKSGKARAIGLRLAQSMGKLRRAADLEPLQPLLKKYINFLEVEVLPSTSEPSRPRVQLKRADVWLGFKSLLGFLEAPAFEDGILERYPIFLNIVLNHVSDDTSDLSCAVSCLKASFEMLGCKLWLRTTLSPSVMRNTLLGHCFHTRDEKSHKEIFDLFLPFLQSLEALQDGEHEKQRRNILYFLLHQVTRSSNFSVLMRKNASKIALLIVQRGYTMRPPCPPSECGHMWGPSLISSLKDTSLHSSLRQPAFDLMNILIISDASALISFKLKYQSVIKAHESNSVMFVDDEDELPFCHDAEEKDYSCWNDFSVLNKLTSRGCKDWTCVPFLWYLTMVQLDPSKLPIDFSKAVFWALSHISVLEPGSATESSVPVDDWLSSHAREISLSFCWQLPNGSDDGGDGKESRNTVKVSQFCTQLMRIFKRFASYFIMQIEKCGLQKQWTWEPMMSESLILALVDHHDNVRQAGLAILEHVSQSRSLTSGLQFLCSSASSLSAVFLGLRYVVRLVESKSVLTDFHGLHQLFFVMCKLLREVVVQQPSVAQPTRPSEGGFLRQPFLNLPITPPEHVVDIISWERFSTLLSATLWPFVVTCLGKGEELIHNQTYQVACVRLLELLPIVYERVNSYLCTQSCNMITMVPDPSDVTWLFQLINWGKSSLLVIIRHWKQCMLSLFERLKGSHSGTIQGNLDDLVAVISNDVANTDELKERVSNLKLAVSKEASTDIERRPIVERPRFVRPTVSSPASIGYAVQERHIDEENVVDVETRKPSHAADSETVILLSDSEEEQFPAADVASKEVLCSVMENDRSTTSDTLSKHVKSSQQKLQIEDRQVSLKYQIVDPTGDNCASSKPVSTDSRSNSAALKGVSRTKMSSVSLNANNTPIGQKKVQSSFTATCQPLHPKSSSDKEKFKSIFRDISDDEDDPLEHALGNCRRPQLLSTKPSILVPKRQIVQLPLPAGNKQGSIGRMEAGSRRLKPPKLDSWYKDILEMDYFAVVGLSSEINKKPDLKEVPVRFNSQAQYIEIFRPLVLEEFKAQLQNASLETPIDMICGSISILSVERVDDFLIVRGRPEDSESVTSKGCTENDLILLTKEPLKGSGQQVHVLGKVERRDKTDKNKALIFVIRFFLSNENARLNKVKRLLVERSKWFLSRVMSMTPQFREFSALSSLNDIPVLPVILNPDSCPPSYHESGKVHLDKLAHSIQKVLKSSYNDSQLQAVSVAIGSTVSKTDFELSLIQGPPGTGKTRTIVAIVSALLSLHADNSCKFPRNESLANVGCTNARAKISQSAAIARAWQDAAFAKQMMRDCQRESSRMTERLSKGRVLICAQSNAAVDELVSRLSQGLHGADGMLYKPYIVRVGNAKTVHHNSIPFFIDTLVEQRLKDELTNTNGKGSSDAESSSSFRAKLEKIVDRIRYYESRRKLIEGDTKEKDPLVHNEDDIDDVSDEAIGAKLNFLYAQKRAVSAELAAAHAQEKKIADENRSLKHKVRKSILGEAEIVVTTLSGCGGDIYGVCSESASANKYGNFSEHSLFDVVVIDEAAQALEPATLIPLQLLKSKGTKCIMVGDPKQLPATVMSGLASKFLYECSMFERLQRAGYPVIMLTEQYRMHPEISRFPSLHFYENKLLDGAQMDDKSAAFHDHHCLGPYMFFDITDGHERSGKNAATQSLCNGFEADAAIEILTFLRKSYPSEFSCRKIGIITPYRSQLSLLRSRFTSLFGSEIVAEMEINTVDGFQGREVDILVLSTVRASDSSSGRRHAGEPCSINIGFVADVRRMNVALTRARFSLWIVGNARTLQTNAHWASLIQNAKERNLFVSVKRPYGLMFGKVCSHSKDILGTSHSNHTSHLKQKENDKIVAPSVMNSQRSDAEIQKEHATYAGRTVEKDGRSLLNDPPVGPKASQDLIKNSDQAKRRSRWDQKGSKGQDPMVRRYSEEKKSVDQNDNMGTTKGALERDTYQNSMVRKHGEEKKPFEHNNNNIENDKDSVKRDSHQYSMVRRPNEVKRPSKQKDHMETSKVLFNQDSDQNYKVRKHGEDKKAASQNDDMETIKGSSKCDDILKSPDMKNLIKKAKGSRKLSEQPRSGNLNRVDPSLSFKHDATLESVPENDDSCPPTYPDMTKLEKKANGSRKFSEQLRSGNSSQVNLSPKSVPGEVNCQMTELKKSKATNPSGQNQLLAERKRQREAVESFLASALISSKNPSSKHPSKKQK